MTSRRTTQAARDLQKRLGITFQQALARVRPAPSSAAAPSLPPAQPVASALAERGSLTTPAEEAALDQLGGFEHTPGLWSGGGIFICEEHDLLSSAIPRDVEIVNGRVIDPAIIDEYTMNSYDYGLETLDVHIHALLDVQWSDTRSNASEVLDAGVARIVEGDADDVWLQTTVAVIFSAHIRHEGEHTEVMDWTAISARREVDH